MQDFRSFFKDKKITLMGLGLLGRGVGDAIFLAEQGAELTVTDLKTKAELKESLEKLKNFSNIKYTLGGHDLKDFENKDMILKAAGVPLDSKYIAYAREHGVSIEMDESLFAKLAQGVKIIGVTGTRGKSTTTSLIYEIIKLAGMPVHLGGNLRGMATLPLLNKIKKGDTVVLELSSWQLQGFKEAEISPEISVFTNFMPDHMNYYNNDQKLYFTDKSYIYKFQKKNDVLILGPSLKGVVKDAKGKVIHVNIKEVPSEWKLKLKGKHNLENIACALEVAKVLKITNKVIKQAVENFQAMPGRMERVRNVDDVEIYNDTNSCTPEATSAALEALGNAKKRNIVLIFGGSDKNLSFKKLIKDIGEYTKAVVLIPGSGTKRIMPDLKNIKNLDIYEEKDLQSVITKAQEVSKKGDIILFSPGFTSFGMFLNEYDRGDKFMEIVRRLK